MNQNEYIKMDSLHASHWWFRAKKEIILYLIKKFKPDTKEILDIGCGPGDYFEEYTGMGIEPCSIFKDENIINTEIEQVNLNKKFDTILCLDVLEHLKDDTVIKRYLDTNLNEHGLSIITVPAHRKLFSEHDLSHEHYRRYDKEDLEQLLKGYNHKIYFYNSLLYPLEYVVRKLTGGKDNMNTLPKLLNEILYNIFRLEKYFLKYFTTGMSLIAVIER